MATGTESPMSQKRQRKQTIIRARHDSQNPYFASSRKPPQDKQLSWEARGVLWYLLSKPSDWEIRPEDLEQNCGKNKVYGILKELQRAGYLRRVVDRDEHGRFVGHYYQVIEQPFPQNPQVDNPEMENPQVENSDSNILKSNTELESGTELEKSESGAGERVSASNPAGESPEETATTTTIVDPDVASVSKVYEQEIGNITQTVSELIPDAIKDYTADWVIQAIKRAVIRNKRNWGTVLGILKSWQAQGFIDSPEPPKAGQPGYKLDDPGTWTEDKHPSPKEVKEHKLRQWYHQAYIKAFEITSDNWWRVFRYDKTNLIANILQANSDPVKAELLKPFAAQIAEVSK